MMDPSAANVNVTVDDWSSVLFVAQPSNWQTPDPNANTTPWLDGTFHLTNTKNATINFYFTGPAIYIYGASGPSYGSYSVSISDEDEASAVTQSFSAHAPTNGSDPHLLYGSSDLTYAKHTLTLTNLGAQSGDEGAGDFLLDFILQTVQAGPAGATLTNTTVYNTDPLVKYTGTWGNNTSPLFPGGASSFTNADGATVSFTFQGSTLYAFGDTVNDHGQYSVTLDSNPPQIYSTVSGCGGSFRKFCERTVPSLVYFASNLGNEMHTVTIKNIAVNDSYFDFNRFVYTTPSTYAPVPLSSGTSPFVSTTATGTGSAQASSTNTSNSSAMSSLTLSHPLLLLFFGIVWCLRSSRH